MYRTASGRLIVAILVAMLVALGYTSQVLDAKKPPKPDPDPPDPPPVLYEVIWIPGLADPDDSTEVFDVNALGEFVGRVRALHEPFTLAIYGQVDKSGNLLFVDYLNELLPQDLNAVNAIGINDQGRIVGHCQVDDGAGGQTRRVFAYEMQTGAVQVMDAPDYEESRQEALRLAEDGSVVGQIGVPDDNLGFIWIPGTDPIVLSPNFGQGVYVTGINDFDQIVGNFGWGGPMFYSAPPYEQPVDLGETILPVGCDPKQDINNTGTIVGTTFGKGQCFYASWCVTGEYAWNPLPSKYSSYAVSINEVGQICGGAQRFKQANKPWTVFVDDPMDGYWLLVDDLITGDPADVGEWHRGEGIENDNVPAAISEPEADIGYGFIAGYKELGWVFNEELGGELFVARGFVLTPVLPD